MNSQLDQRIRRAVVEVVDRAPPPPAFNALPIPVRPHRPARRALAVAVAAFSVITLALSAAWLVRDGALGPDPVDGPALRSGDPPPAPQDLAWCLLQSS
jgi:hypothetical protein